MGIDPSAAGGTSRDTPLSQASRSTVNRRKGLTHLTNLEKRGTPSKHEVREAENCLESTAASLCGVAEGEGGCWRPGSYPLGQPERGAPARKRRAAVRADCCKPRPPKGPNPKLIYLPSLSQALDEPGSGQPSLRTTCRLCFTPCHQERDPFACPWRPA